MRDYVNVTPKTEKEKAVVSWGTLLTGAVFVTVCFIVLDAIAADVSGWFL